MICSFFRRNLLVQSWRIPIISGFSVRRISSSIPRFSQAKVPATSHKEHDAEEEDDQPIKFTSSPAFRTITPNPSPIHRKPPPFWGQEYIVQLSLISFLVYFGILREENDVDLKMKIDLGEPDAEEKLLELEKRGADVEILREQLSRVRMIENRVEATLPSWIDVMVLNQYCLVY